MQTFTVTINSRPLGVRFGHFKDDNKKSIATVHQVLIGSHGSKVGLNIGDTLIAVNNECVSYLTSSEALTMFRKQESPFQASFSRQIEEEKPETIYNSDNEDEVDSLWSSYVNNNTPSFAISNSNSNTKSLKIPFLNVDSYLSLSDSENTVTPLSISDSYSPVPFSGLSIADSYSLTHKPSVSMITQSSADTENCFQHNIDKCIIIDDEYYQDYDNIDTDTKHVVSGFMRQFDTENSDDKPDIFQVLTANYLYNNTVMFDKRAEKMTPDSENTKVITVSSNGFKYGIHEWSIKILKIDVDRQEIGVIENIDDIQNIICLKGGVTKTPGFGARAVYGNELCRGNSYYASVNDNKAFRCKKRINNKIGWTQGAVIKTVLNLRKGSIQWFLNGEKVRKTISVQKGKVYYPIIAFSGNCQYELIDVN